jgi:hypothetical protein
MPSARHKNELQFILQFILQQNELQFILQFILHRNMHISVCGKRPSLSLETGGLGDSGHTRGGPDRSGLHPGGLNPR